MRVAIHVYIDDTSGPCTTPCHRKPRIAFRNLKPPRHRLLLHCALTFDLCKPIYVSLHFLMQFGRSCGKNEKNIINI